jgi:DNA-binding transcriptional LysR family regulator
VVLPELLRLPSFLGVARIVAQTELLAIVPRLYDVKTADTKAIRMLQLPVALPTYLVKQHWHERCHADPSNRWLRQVIAHLFG